VLYLVALACTLVLLYAADPGDLPLDLDEAPEPQAAASKRRGLAATVAAGSIVALLSIVADWAVVRAIHGDRFAGHAGFHIRFGPRATISRPENR
jgi:hypothetical protein